MNNINRISDSELIAEYNSRFQLKAGAVLSSSIATSKHFRTYFEFRDREQFAVAYLNGRNELIKTEILFTGSIGSSAVYIRELIKNILKYESVAIILSHNHPSGNINPSKEDVKITKRIIKACELIDVTVHDHIIVAKDSYSSFIERGLI